MTIVIFIDDDDDGEPEWRWWFAKSCLQVHLSVISSVFSTANVNMSVCEINTKDNLHPAHFPPQDVQK